MNKKARTKERKKEIICELYKRRTCPHGKSGKKEIDGKPCPHDHPKRCFRFCDFGSRHEKGCDRGKRCRYWHPKLCKYSLRGTACESQECTFQHLVLHRKPLHPTDEARKSSYRRQQELEPPAAVTAKRDTRRVSLAPSNEMTERKQMWLPKVSTTSSIGACQPTVNKLGQQKRQNEEESFLLKLIENMRAGFQEQINGLREEIVTEIETRYQSSQIGAPTGNAPADSTHVACRPYPPYPVAAQQSFPTMMAPQMPAPQWFNQCRPLSF